MRRALLGVLLLAACQKAGVVPRKTLVADSTAPDQTMKTMKMTIVRHGVRAADVEADSAFINQQTQVADLVTLKITFFDSTSGRVMSVVTSRTGKYNMLRESLDARGNVVATTNDQNVLKTEHLEYDKIQNRIHSDTLFTFNGPTQHSSGASFETDPAFRSVTVIKPRGREIAAPPARKRPAKDSGR